MKIEFNIKEIYLNTKKMDKITALSPPLSEVNDVPVEIDEDENAPYVYIILKKMIKRLSDDIENDKSVGDSSQELKMFLNIQTKEIKKSLEMVNLVKESLTKFIATNGIQLMEEYSSICNDSKFDNYTIPFHKKADELVQPIIPPLGAEDILNIDRYVENNCRWNIIRKANKPGAPIIKKKKKIMKYIVGQIVGAKDKEGKWWMSRILYVFEDPNYPYPWYYVHFEGWGDIQNEWISSLFRIKKFNPRRDFLRR
jgi:hypothetical protein